MAHNTSTANVGARYANALFELAIAQGRLPAVEADLKGLEAARLESGDFRRLLESPVFAAEDKGRAVVAVAQAAGVDELTLKFLGLLSANGRASALPAVAKSFAALCAANRGAVSAEVTTALPLDAAQQAGLVAALRQALGKVPEMTLRVDPAILGGLKVKVGSRLFDSSLKTRLDQMKFALTRA